MGLDTILLPLQPVAAFAGHHDRTAAAQDKGNHHQFQAPPSCERIYRIQFRTCSFLGILPTDLTSPSTTTAGVPNTP